ncbi:unnamed protein product [Darwinula stevensoni]|uniref:Uncharacterized protein n=1 Tax=Darwinula stevensoni TaxID=69355 RepID=A0A7R8X5A6_9CRUS|nr:unnamed protein product [Darwinula stevensoni]CAG0879919.1 unnamed protein product [Darwinula stevensoni]
MTVGPSFRDDLIQEMVRYGGSELHTVAAFVGGCAAHESIKLLTCQYVPLDNTLIYNGLTGSCATFKF